MIRSRTSLHVPNGSRFLGSGTTANGGARAGRRLASGARSRMLVIALVFFMGVAAGLALPMLAHIASQRVVYSAWAYRSRKQRPFPRGAPLVAPTLANFFLSGANDLYIFYQHYRARRDTPRAVAVVVHGLGENLHRYDALVETLRRDCGMAVFALDLPGHGKSEGDRLFVQSFDEYTAAIKELAGIARTMYAEAPLVILGHSMGGLCVARCVQQNPGLFAAQVLTGPALDVDASAFERALGPLIAGVFPKLPFHASSPLLLCHDAAVVDWYCNDPGSSIAGVPARVGLGILDNIDIALARAAEAPCPPTLIVRGALDSICHRPGTLAFYAALKGDDKTYLEMEGLEHEVYNEPGGKALGAVAAWLATRFPQTAAVAAVALAPLPPPHVGGPQV